MTLDTVILASIYLLAAYVLFWLGKRVFDFLHRDFRVREELVERKNSALALALVGYYLGVVFAIGGAIVGPSSGLVDDVLDLFLYGILAIILLNISTLVSDRLILFQFSNTKEIIQDQNAGTGVTAGAYICGYRPDSVRRHFRGGGHGLDGDRLLGTGPTGPDSDRARVRVDHALQHS